MRRIRSLLKLYDVIGRIKEVKKGKKKTVYIVRGLIRRGRPGENGREPMYSRDLFVANILATMLYDHVHIMRISFMRSVLLRGRWCGGWWGRGWGVPIIVVIPANYYRHFVVVRRKRCHFACSISSRHHE